MFRYGLSEDGERFQAKKFSGLMGSAEKLDRSNENIRIGVVLDTETTGLDYQRHEIIEVAARKIAFDRLSGEIVWLGGPFQSLQQPSEPLAPEVTALTGLTDADLEGQAIDWQEFDEYIDEAAIVIAHHAAFDRPFVEQFSKKSPKKIWGCSLTQIQWCNWFPSTKLQLLTLMHGYFYDAHRALIDVDALITLLGYSLPEDEGQTYLFQLLESARQPSNWVIANNAPFEAKSKLKQNGYRWINRIWRKRVSDMELEDEKEFLTEVVYEANSFPGEVRAIKVTDTFKAEVFEGKGDN